MTLKIMFTGGTTLQVNRNTEDYNVGPAGELRVYKRAGFGKRVDFIVAPGQWRYITVVED